MAAPNRGEVWAYKDRDFKGELVRYANDTANLGKFNDQISSVRVGPNTTAVLFSDADYKGNMKVLTGDVNYVGSDFNDKASSLIILPPRGEVVFFEDAHFRGKSHSFNTDVPNLSSLGQNDKYSSVKTDPATAVEVFADKDFKGKSVIWSGAVAEFGAFNDKVSSFRIRK